MMKAVNGLKGDLNNTYCPRRSTDQFLYTIKNKDNIQKKYVCTNNKTECWGDLVCTVSEFNALIAELSNWQPTLPKVETVEVDGMVYEIGKLYMFKDSRANDYFVGVLADVDNESGLKFCTTIDNLKEWYQECEEVIYDIGTITPAPTKLIDGEAYKFEYIAGKFIGIYCEKENEFHLSHGRLIKLNLCSNITRLVPEIK